MTTIQSVYGKSGIVPSNVELATASTSGGPAILLPDPVSLLSLSGDPGAELAALVVEQGQSQQDAARTARDGDEQLEVSEDNEEVAAMHQKATETRDAGIVDGVGMAVEGGAAVGASFVACPHAGDPPKLADAIKAGGKVADGVAQVGSAFAKGAEASSDANAAAHRANAEQDRQAAEDMHDAQKAGTDLVSAAVDFYREYASTKAQTQSAALHRA